MVNDTIITMMSSNINLKGVLKWPRDKKREETKVKKRVNPS